MAQRLTLETQLRSALERRQFELHYQPKIELATGRISGLEALLRWRGPQGALISPGHFIPVLEETGLIIAVGQWVLAQAVTDLPLLLARGLGGLPIAVNVSPLQLRERGFINDVRATLRPLAAKDRLIEIEITEGVFLDNLIDAEVKLRALRELGIKIAIDDFGTGYSSLTYLSKLPVDTMKIDQTFTARMIEDAQSRGIVSAIMALAHTLNLRVTAEGVEKAEQADLLRRLGCDEAQGYLFGRPVPLGELPDQTSAVRH